MVPGSADTIYKLSICCQLLYHHCQQKIDRSDLTFSIVEHCSVCPSIVLPSVDSSTSKPSCQEDAEVVEAEAAIEAATQVCSVGQNHDFAILTDVILYSSFFCFAFFVLSLFLFHTNINLSPAMISFLSGPAIMLMPPGIRATFMPNPPLKHCPPIRRRRKNLITGITPHMTQIAEKIKESEEKAKLESPNKAGKTPQQIREERKRQRAEDNKRTLEPLIEKYRKEQQECGGEFDGMNCYNTLFIGRLAYEVTERKLLREMEAFGPVKDLRIIQDKSKSESADDLGKSRGYAFVEYEREEDMKRAYRAADGMRLEGREIVVDVERGHTVPSWLPRRLGGGLGGTRIGSKHENINRPGRFDPNKPDLGPPPPPMMGGAPPPTMGRGTGPPMGYSDRGRPGPGGYDAYPPPPGGGYRDRGPPRYDDRYDDRKRRRGDSPGRSYGGGGRPRRY